MIGRPSLVLFDCDGVLVDSEPIALRVLVAALTAAGVRVTEATAQARFLGRSLSATRAAVEAEDGVVLGEAWVAGFRAAMLAALRAGLRAVDGAGAAADALRAAGRAVCVASSSEPGRIRLSLELTGLLPRFAPHLYSATMVARGKPAPDLFLFAAQAMGVPPAACLVVEDSPAGVEAARRAGMAVLGFAGASHARSPAHRLALERAGAHAVFDAMGDLAALAGAA